MKRAFRFRLQRVARVRESQESAARMTWSLAERSAVQAEELVRHSRAELVQAQRDQGRLQQTTPMEPAEVLLAQRAVHTLQSALRVRMQAADTARSRAQLLRGEWLEAERARRALEQLEHDARRTHRAEVEKADNAAMDETAATRANSAQRALRADSRK